jgi:glutathione S-transferase
MSRISLKYWNGRGLMEVPRMLLAISGKFPGEDYEDGRFSAPADGLESNLGRMPVATIDGKSVGQSAAVNFFIASECGLMGTSSYEAAMIISTAEHLKEMMQAYLKIVPWGTQPSEETSDMWFNTGATDLEGPADRGGMDTRYLTWWAGRIEKTLGDAGYAVGNQLSLADVLIYYIFSETLADDQCPPDFAQHRKEPFGSRARTEAFLAKHPKLKASCDAVANNENIKKWRDVRGMQHF